MYYLTVYVFHFSLLAYGRYCILMILLGAGVDEVESLFVETHKTFQFGKMDL